ncbi:MAG: hypothetical protein J7J21_00775, partial [Methanomicrobia archaeon]|nr:hypothetical protein [Methanomicrobia archaeon]
MIKIEKLYMRYNIELLKFVGKIRKPKEDKKLPIVLSRKDVSQIISSIVNIKRKAIPIIWNDICIAYMN